MSRALYLFDYLSHKAPFTQTLAGTNVSLCGSECLALESEPLLKKRERETERESEYKRERETDTERE